MHRLEEELSGFHNYISQKFASEDEPLTASRKRAAAQGLPRIRISPSQGKLMQTPGTPLAMPAKTNRTAGGEWPPAVLLLM